MDKRSKEVDIAKAICIILVVMGHASCPFREWIYLFHVAMFFWLSGYLFNYNREPFKIVYKTMRSLYIWYVLANTLYVIFHNYFFRLGFYTFETNILNGVYNGYRSPYVLSESLYDIKVIIVQILKGLLFHSKEQFMWPSWFIKTLILIELWIVFIKLLKLYNHITNMVLCVVCLGIGYLGPQILPIIPDTIWICASCGSIFFAGSLCKYLNIIEKISNLNMLIQIILAVINILFLITMLKYGNIELSQNRFVNPLFLIVASSAGIIMIMCTSSIIYKVTNKKCRIIEQLLVFIGQNTLPVLFGHLLCFKLITIVIINVYSLPESMKAAFFTLVNKQNYFWWIIYSLDGVILPLVVLYFFKKTQQKEMIK